MCIHNFAISIFICTTCILSFQSFLYPRTYIFNFKDFLYPYINTLSYLYPLPVLVRPSQRLNGRFFLWIMAISFSDLLLCLTMIVPCRLCRSALSLSSLELTIGTTIEDHNKAHPLQRVTLLQQHCRLTS